MVNNSNITINSRHNTTITTFSISKCQHNPTQWLTKAAGEIACQTGLHSTQPSFLVVRLQNRDPIHHRIGSVLWNS